MRLSIRHSNNKPFLCSHPLGLAWSPLDLKSAPCRSLRPLLPFYAAVVRATLASHFQQTPPRTHTHTVMLRAQSDSWQIWSFAHKTHMRISWMMHFDGTMEINIHVYETRLRVELEMLLVRALLIISTNNGVADKKASACHIHMNGNKSL